MELRSAAARPEAFECGSGPCDPPPVVVEPEPAQAAWAAGLRPLPADMEAWALDPTVDPSWRAPADGRPERLGNVPPAPDEYDATPADEVQEAGYRLPPTDG